MSHNPYAPSENWNAGAEKPRAGVPLWALLVACMSTLALGCVGGIVGGFAIGFAAGESTSSALDEYLQSDNYSEVSVVARPVPAEHEDHTHSLEVLVNNLTEETQRIEMIDVYHELFKPSELVITDPPFTGMELYEDSENPENTYTEYRFDPIAVGAGETVVVRFDLHLSESRRRTGDVDVWVNEGFTRTHVHFPEAQSPRDPGY